MTAPALLAPKRAAAPKVLGSAAPRLFTPPLRRLTRTTSYGFEVIDFARDVLNLPLDPWQEWAVKHAGELLPDGRPRFRQVLLIVARQAGKTHLLTTLALFWLFKEQHKLVLGMSTNRDTAHEAWAAACELAQEVPALADRLGRNGVRTANGQEHLLTDTGARYKIAASNRRGGRGLAIDRLIIDELREHDDWTAYNAATPAMNARPHAQAFMISNQGDENAIVLDALRSSALHFLDTGEGDARLGLLEWSAEDDADPLDPAAWAAANPNLGRRVDHDTIAGPARRAARAGGAELAGFRTEILCQRVRMLNPAIDGAAWRRCLDVGTLDDVRSRVALCVDVSPDQQHATLVAAATLDDGRVRVEVVGAWEGSKCTQEMRAALPALVARIRPRSLGWFPSGPAAALAADLADRKKSGRTGWPPPGTLVEEIRGEIASCCMGLNEQVVAGRVAHSADPLLDMHVGGAERLKRGDAWVFSRKGEGHCDAAYAAAGAVHLARTMPPPVGKPRLILAR